MDARTVMIALALMLFGTASHAATIRCDDLALEVNDAAQVTGLSIAGTDVNSEAAPIAELADVTRGTEFVEGVADGGSIDTGLRVNFPGLDAAATITSEARGASLRLTFRLEGAQNLPARGVLLRINLPVDALGWRWHDDMQTTREIGSEIVYENVRALRAWPDLPEWTDKPSLRVGAANRNFLTVLTGPVGLVLAAPMDRACIFRTAYDPQVRRLQLVYDLALSPDTDPPNEWTFATDLYSCDPGWGFRDALERYYALYPEFFEVYWDEPGMWMAFSKLSQIDNVNEFRFGLQEGAPEVAYDDLIDVQDTIYLTHAGQFANIPDHDPEADPLPPHERLVEVMSDTFNKRTREEGIYEAVGLHDVEGKLDIQKARVYGHIIAQFNLDPDLPYGGWTLKEADGRTASILERTGGRLDGFYYDGLSTGLNYRTDHFATSAAPPMWDPVAEKPVLNNFFSSCEFARAAAEKLRPQDQITMMNGAFGSSFYVAPWLDVFGGETGLRISREEMNYLRSVARHKPMLTLLKGNFEKNVGYPEIELFHKRCLAYGIFPGFFDWPPSGLGPGGRYWEHPEYYERDRDIFRKYQPLVQTLAASGWQPVTHARSSSGSVFVERYGPGEDGIVWLTLLNEDAEAHETTIAIDAEALGLDAAAVECMDVLSGRLIALSRDGDQLEAQIGVESDGVMMLQVATPAQAAAWRLDEARRVVALGQTMREVDAQTERPAIALSWHEAYADGYAREQTDDGYALVLDGTERSTQGAWQWAMLFQPEPGPATIRMRVAAEGVEGDEYVRLMARHAWVSPSYSHYEIEYFDLPKGTYDWQELKFTINVDQPLRAIYLRPEMHASVSGKLKIASITIEDQFGNDYVENADFAQWYEPLSEDLRQRMGLTSAQLLDAIAGAQSAGDLRTEGARDRLLAIGALTTSARSDIIARGAENAARRMLRDLEAVETRLMPAVLAAYGIAAPTLTAPASVAAGDEVPVGFSIGDTGGLPVRTSIAVDEPATIAADGDRHLLRVPPTAEVGQRLTLTGEALLGPEGRAVPVRATRSLDVVAPLELRLISEGTDDATGAFRVGLLVRNNRSRAVEAAVEVTAPEGWTAPDARTVELAPGAQERASLLIEPREGAEAGSVEIAATASAGGATARDAATMLYIPASANLLRNPGFEDGITGWSTAGTGQVEADAQIAHGGAGSVRLNNPTRSESSQVSQTITLNQERAAPVLVRAASRGEGITGPPSRSWALYVDIYYTDGTPLYGRTFDFSAETEDWQVGELVIEPEKPIRNVNVYLLLRGRKGTVWFDDAAVMEDPRRTGNVAREASVTVDSSYRGYSAEPLTDGIAHPAADAHWTEEAWASEETAAAHWIELRFDAPRTIERAAIEWSMDAGVARTSKEVSLQVAEGDGWRTVMTITPDAPTPRSEMRLDEPVTAERIRIYQPGGKGPEGRGNLMWVREVELFEGE
jgi:hypothetical protein